MPRLSNGERTAFCRVHFWRRIIVLAKITYVAASLAVRVSKRGRSGTARIGRYSYRTKGCSACRLNKSRAAGNIRRALRARIGRICIRLSLGGSDFCHVRNLPTEILRITRRLGYLQMTWGWVTSPRRFVGGWRVFRMARCGSWGDYRERTANGI